jgi:hypothetical protein
MFNRRFAFIALFLFFYLVIEMIARFSLWLAVPGGPPIDLAREWVQLLLLPLLMGVMCVFFPVDEDRFPFRTMLIAVAVYWVYLASVVVARRPTDLGPVFEALLLYSAAMGVIAGLAAFGARRILLAYEAQGNGGPSTDRNSR